MIDRRNWLAIGRMWFQFNLNNSYSSKYSAMKSKPVEPHLCLVNVILMNRTHTDKLSSQIRCEPWGRRMTRSPDPPSLIETIGAAGLSHYTGLVGGLPGQSQRKLPCVMYNTLTSHNLYLEVVRLWSCRPPPPPTLICSQFAPRPIHLKSPKAHRPRRVENRGVRFHLNSPHIPFLVDVKRKRETMGINYLN